MNSVVILPHECTSPGHASVTGLRAAYLYHTHELRAGVCVAGAVLGGLRGRVTVVTATPELCELDLSLEMPPLPVNPLTLVVGIARPQLMKRVLHAAVALGAERLDLVRTANSEKSYLDAKLLEPSALSEEIVKALEQTGDSRAPSVRLHERFRPYIEDDLAPRIRVESAPLALLAHADVASKPLDPRALRVAGQNIIVAVGPEKGWNEYEVDRFRELSFLPVSLGPRTLRVD